MINNLMLFKCKLCLLLQRFVSLMPREIAAHRASLRNRDIAESKLLLWELVTHEPTVLQCFNVIETTCLAQGIHCKIDNERCSDDFQDFVDKHYGS